MNYQPTGDKVIIFVAKETETKTKTGLTLLSYHRESSYINAVVVAVGPGRILPSGGQRVPVYVKEGQTVMVSRFNGSRISPENAGYTGAFETGDDLRLIIEDDIVAIIDE